MIYEDTVQKQRRTLAYHWVERGCLILLCLVTGCASPSRLSTHYVFWDNLDPTGQSGEAFKQATEQFRNILLDEKQKDGLVRAVEEMLQSSRLSYPDQVRASVVVNGLIAVGTRTNDVLRLLDAGKSHPDFIGLLYLNTALYSPDYIETAFDVLAGSDDRMTRLIGHDGATTKQHLGAIVLRGLRRATGQDLGPDDKAWREWWKKAKGLQGYDADKGKYGKPGN